MTVHIEVYGSGRPLVMIHGWAMHGGVWREFARRLSRDRRVICLDLPGHGRSDAIANFTLPEIGDVLLDAIPEQKFSLLGWSLGGTVAIDMASRFPERVESLALLASNPRFVQSDDWPGMAPEAFSAFATTLASDIELTLMRFLALQVNGLPDGRRLLQMLKLALRECEPPSLDVLRAGLAILEESDLREALKNILCPVFAVFGGRDKLVPAASGQAMKNIIPEMTMQVLESAGHAAFLSHDRQLSEILGGAL